MAFCNDQDLPLLNDHPAAASTKATLLKLFPPRDSGRGNKYQTQGPPIFIFLLFCPASCQEIAGSPGYCTCLFQDFFRFFWQNHTGMQTPYGKDISSCKAHVQCTYGQVHSAPLLSLCG